MSEDLHGCPLSTHSPEVIHEVNQFSQELLKLGKKMDGILEGVRKHPQEVILQIYAAIFCLYGQTGEMQQQAQHYLDKAAALLDQANERETSLYEAARAWYNRKLSEALKRFERHCYKWPKDLTALKVTEFLFYCKGQKYESKRFLRLTSQCYHEHKEDPFFLSIHSFALELTEHYEESRLAAEHALQLNAENPWAHHTLSHVYINQGLIDEGIDVLEHYYPSWQDFNRLIESHNTWHLALLYLENLDFDKTQEVYQRANWLHKTQMVGEEIDAASLLWRLDFEGEDNAEKWKELAESIGNHATFEATPFITAQLCYALKRGNQIKALEEALAQTEEFAKSQHQEDRFVWKKVGLPLIHGALAYADKQYREALTHLDPIMKEVDCVGGSDAQVAVFHQLYLKCLMGGQRYTDAQALIHEMTQGRDLTKLERKWLAESQVP
jgi:tetratricopeptide (TPR) repeat protein